MKHKKGTQMKTNKIKNMLTLPKIEGLVSKLKWMKFLRERSSQEYQNKTNSSKSRNQRTSTKHYFLLGPGIIVSIVLSVISIVKSILLILGICLARFKLIFPALVCIPLDFVVYIFLCFKSTLPVDYYIRLICVLKIGLGVDLNCF